MYVQNSSEVWSKRFNIELNVLENKVESAFERIIDLETKPQVRIVPVSTNILSMPSLVQIEG